jgi:hypothetical protein
MGTTCNFGFTFPKNSLNCDSTGLLVAEQASAHELEREHLVGNFFPRRPIWAIEVRRFGQKFNIRAEVLNETSRDAVLKAAVGLRGSGVSIGRQANSTMGATCESDRREANFVQKRANRGTRR